MTYERFKHLTFDGFKRLAQDASLSRYEKIGFPDSYREGKEEDIFADIVQKLPALTQKNKTVLDIGIGCSGLAFMLIDLCRKNNHTLIAVDSEEMLSHLPDEQFITKTPGFYPHDCSSIFSKYASEIDAILTYSVIQYVFVETSVFDFIDRSLALLSEGGAMLIGDIPNISKRNRFFSSPSGIRYHQEFIGELSPPIVRFNTIEQGQVDDSAVISIIMRVRAAGFEAYLVPQADNLPMSNRREDILIRRP